MDKKIVFASALSVLSALLFVTGCNIEVNDPVRQIPIVEPYISVQPKSYSFNTRTYEGAPTLSVGVSEWNGMDGDISYQWYTFANIEDYCKEPIGGTPIAAGPNYRPALRVLANTKYYFYAVVTNSFADAIGAKTSSVQSELSIISFYDGNNTAPVPVITKHPVNASYTMGRTNSVTPLEVKAERDGSGTLTYQWFTNTTFSATGGTPIDGADASAFMPLINSLARGENYFYVQVTNTSGYLTPSTVTCLPITVTMLPGEKAEAPRITQQPKDQLAFTVAAIPALSVTAESIDNGELSWQWYSMDKPASTFTMTGGVRTVSPPVVIATLTGENKKTFTPTAAGYYRVTIKNFNENVLGATEATIDSRIVTVRVADAGTPSANAFIKLGDPNKPENRYQYIRGYGGMDVAWLNFPMQLQADTHAMYNPDWGLGFNILRIMIMPPGSTDGNYVDHDTIMNKVLNSGSIDDNNYKGDYINNVKIVNDYGGYVLASPWSPPKEWKTNNSVNSGGHLIPTYYKKFANYLRSFCQYMYYAGAPVYAVSIANEPNYAGGYDGCEWEDYQMRDFFKEVGRFTEGVRGKGGGRNIPRVLTMNGESANTPNINNSALLDPAARSVIDLYARHVYGEQQTTLWENQYADYKEGSQFETECWMTEHNINSATASQYPNDWTWDYLWRFMNDVDLVIRLNSENAFVWWANVRFYSYIGDSVANTVRGAILPRGWGLSHYAKYSIGTRRLAFSMTGTVEIPNANNIGYTSPRNIGAIDVGGSLINPTGFDMDGREPKITAFTSPDGSELSLVMFTPSKADTTKNNSAAYNLGTIEITMPDNWGEIGSVQAQRSVNADSTMVRENVTISTDRQKAYVTLGPREILSLKFTRK